MPQQLRLRVEGTGLPIVLLHGWGLNSGVFEQLVARLSQNFSCYLIDLPGFGENADIPLTTLDKAAQHIADVIPDAAIVLGWSMGGLVATELALTYPDKIKKLVTVASSPMFMAQDNWPGIAPKVLHLFESQLAHDYSATLQRFLAIQAMGSPSAKSDILALKKSIQAYPDPCEASLLVGLKWLSEIDLRPRLGDIQQPTLRLYGRLDALVPHAVIADINTLQPAAQSYVFEHVSHAPFMTQLDEFVKQLENFL